MSQLDRRTFVGGMWATGLGTLASRVLGLARDIAMAALLGLGESGVMDAFVVAVRIPSLLRRLFGEGALTASYVPTFTAEHERAPASAWKLASVMLVWLTLVLSALVLVVEALLAAIWWLTPVNDRTAILLGLIAAIFPYVITVCVAALVSATLQSLGRFTIAALSPSIVNVGWLLGAWWLAPHLATTKLGQAYVILGCIQATGLLQVLMQWPSLRAAGFRFDYDWRASRDAALKIGRAVVAVSFGLTITQLNTLLDSVLAWALAESPGGPPTIAWLGGVARPLQAGGAAAIHYGERFYQLPLGILGIAIATAIFPLLSRHAAQGNRQLLGSDLTLGLRVAWFTSLPACVGLVLLAHPIARLVYQHGEFTAADTTRTAHMIAIYSSGVWAFCALPVMMRGYYALGDQLTPVRVGLVAVIFNLLLDFTLVWLLAEKGLALSTTLAAIVQLTALIAIFHSRYGGLDWPEIARSTARTLVASTATAMVVLAMLRLIPEAAATGSQIVRVAAVILSGAGAYLLAAWALRAPELGLLLRTGR